MECAAKGLGRCVSAPLRRCGSCGAVSYCSVSHQLAHWHRHREECDRLGQQLKNVVFLNDFPFAFSNEATLQLLEKREGRCSFLRQWDLHCSGMWKFECPCCDSDEFIDDARLKDSCWELKSNLCPCLKPLSPLPFDVRDWATYYEWRRLPTNSPAALLLHWALTVYNISKIVRPMDSCDNELNIHYLGPEKEIVQLSAFRELLALFPGVQLNIEMIGPAIPESRDGEAIEFNSFAKCLDTECACKFPTLENSESAFTSSVRITLHRGLYHCRYASLAQGSSPHIVIALNAGVAAYASWLPTVELIKAMNVPAVFSDYCEEACHLAAKCLSSVTGRDLALPIQVNPFRQPIPTGDSVLSLPCYSNCFLFGM